MTPIKHIRFRALKLSAIALAISLGFSAPCAFAAPVTTMSDCEHSKFSGTWVSTNADDAFLSKLTITELCKQINKRAVSAENPWADSLGEEQKYIYREYRLRPSSSCYPVDCVWGKRKARLDENGNLQAQFKMFWSQRHLKLTREKQALRIHWRIEYVGRKKPDELGETLMVRSN